MAEKKETAVRKSLGKRLFKAAVIITLVNAAGELCADFLRSRAAKKESGNDGSASKTYIAFGQGREIAVSDRVEQVKLRTVLSGVSLDLSGAQIGSDVSVSVRNIIGGVLIRVPEGVNVSCRNKTIFGGVVNTVPEYEGKNVPAINIETNTVIGGISVRAVKSGEDVVKDYFEEETLRNISKEKESL